ncbi:MAG TPA: formate dehydrogenase subunit delta [Stellaceae bacterium]|nr:formate dehydrogenase subunit delta [Stellaceae bacterium]
MTPQKLASMANQIADFFRAYPAAEAATSIHRHLVTFWTPAMLDTLRAHIAEGAQEVDALVIQALHGAPAPAAGQIAAGSG